MILQALTNCYEALAEKGVLEKPGWSGVNVSWALVLDENGSLVDVLPMEEMEERKGKQVTVPRKMRLPTPVKRSVGIAPNLLCDNASYVLGIDEKGKPERSRQCFEEFRNLHQKKLAGVNHPVARAVLAFLQGWEPARAAECEPLQAEWENIRKAGNIVFLVGDAFLQDVPEVIAVCDEKSETEETQQMVCLVTGRRSPVARLHPSIKGVPGAQSSGASLVSFNSPAFESFGREGAQGMNAPVSEYAAFAYAEALNWLIRERQHHRTMGDTMVVYWAEGGVDALAILFGEALDSVSDEDVNQAIRALANGDSYRWGDLLLHPSNRFYVLGIAPNAARLSVRFFMTDTFGDMVKHLVEHLERLEIDKPSFEKQQAPAFWQILRETVNQKSRDKAPSPTLSGDLPRAVLQGLPYPTTLYQQVQLRIRAGEELSWAKASIIKAYLLKNVVKGNNNHPYKEALTVKLNEETNCAPYVLGRLFAVLEGLQNNANPGINTTIRDRYFNSAFTMPYAVFPTLINLSQAHLKKLSGPSRVFYDRQIQELLCKLDTPYPKRLSLEEQGIFQIGYYHQKQYRYTKKEDDIHE